MQNTSTLNAEPTPPSPQKSLLWRRLTGQLIIDKKNQFSMITYIFVITFFCAVTFQMTMTLNETLAISGTTNWQPLLISSILGYFILFLTIFLAFAVSNKFVGPIFRVRMHMKEIQKTGVIKPVTIRTDDQFQNLAEDYNELLKYFEQNYTKK